MSKDKTVNLVGGLIDAEIQALKKQHGSLMLITVTQQDGEEDHFWFKKPDMSTMSAYMKIVPTDSMRAGQIIFNDCLVKGRKEAANEVETFLSILPELTGIVEKLNTEVKKF